MVAEYTKLFDITQFKIKTLKKRIDEDVVYPFYRNQINVYKLNFNPVN